MVSDEQLMLRFQNGAVDAFTELFCRYREPIYGFFRRRLNDAPRAEELAQETFVAVLRGLARYEPRALFSTYLYGIALNLVAAERRKAGREVHEPSAADPPAVSDPDCALWVRRAIAELGAGEREILLLREYEQLSYEEIARLLRLPLNTVRSRLFRARLALKELLVPEGDQTGPALHSSRIAREKS
jgi:RNA polymerase sigma-70 factor (ECF subfamily)